MTRSDIRTLRDSELETIVASGNPAEDIIPERRWALEELRARHFNLFPTTGSRRRDAARRVSNPLFPGRVIRAPKPEVSNPLFPGRVIR